MNTTDIVSRLSSIGLGQVNGLTAIANEAITLTNQFKAGQLSQADYKELINDLATEKLILVDASLLAGKLIVQQLFNEISAAASIIPL